MSNLFDSKIIFFFIQIFFTCQQFSAIGQMKRNMVQLSGKVKNFGQQVEIENLSEEGELGLGLSERKFTPDSNGRFSISLKLTKPNYFRIGRNILYLAPGCNLYMTIDHKWPDSAEFKGCNSEENIYLKHTPFPFAGSYLESGDSIKPTIQETINTIFQTAKTRNLSLDLCTHLDKVFKSLEKARIKADIINSLRYINSYFPYINKLKGDSLDIFHAEYKEIIKPYLEKYSEKFSNSDFLKIEVYRINAPVILRNGDSITKEALKIKDYLNAYLLAHSIESLTSQKQADSFRISLRKIKTPLYREVLLNTYNQIQKLNGTKVTDFTMVDSSGYSIRLSSFRGKIIFIELWATWCGPCVEEFPFMDSLRNKYRNQDDVLIISLSIDQDKKAWKNYLVKKQLSGFQFNIEPSGLEAYHVLEIPRTIIISKEFTIGAMKGPSPSTKEAYEVIEKLLKK